MFHVKRRLVVAGRAANPVSWRGVPMTAQRDLTSWYHSSDARFGYTRLHTLLNAELWRVKT